MHLRQHEHPVHVHRQAIQHGAHRRHRLDHQRLLFRRRGHVDGLARQHLAIGRLDGRPAEMADSQRAGDVGQAGARRRDDGADIVTQDPFEGVVRQVGRLVDVTRLAPQ
ncbi:hypothetical protein D3C78_1609870 [compost metagenome]